MYKTISASGLFFLALAMAASAYPADLNGVWTKTTLSDPHNITLIYQEKNDVRAVGYGEIEGNKALWYGVGKFEGYPLSLHYRYSPETIPPGWEQEGIMLLEMSEDGGTLSGEAKGASGDWTGFVIFKRLR